MSTITIPTKDGQSFTAYIATPAVTPAPVVIMIQEIFGVNADMRAHCDAMAEMGYLAVCPDLFWRPEPGVDITDKTEAEWKKAFDLYNRFDVDMGVEDLRATLHTMRGHAHSTGSVGCVGYCLGGKLAYLMAARSKVDVSVSYYGVGLDDMLAEGKAIKTPLLMHIAEEDKFVSKDAQAKIKSALSSNPAITIHSYPGVNHAFARINGEHFDGPSADLANGRTRDFLQKALKKSAAA